MPNRDQMDLVLTLARVSKEVVVHMHHLDSSSIYLDRKDVNTEELAFVEGIDKMNFLMQDMEDHSIQEDNLLPMLVVGEAVDNHIQDQKGPEDNLPLELIYLMQHFFHENEKTIAVLEIPFS